MFTKGMRTLVNCRSVKFTVHCHRQRPITQFKGFVMVWGKCCEVRREVLVDFISKVIDEKYREICRLDSEVSSLRKQLHCHPQRANRTDWISGHSRVIYKKVLDDSDVPSPQDATWEIPLQVIWCRAKQGYSNIANGWPVIRISKWCPCDSTHVRMQVLRHETLLTATGYFRST